jgi:ABC-type Fe3+ transport system substrate-binding protein
MKDRIHAVPLLIVLSLLCIEVSSGLVHAAAAPPQSVDGLYAELAKLKPEQRDKRILEGATKEGKLNFIHTFRGALARNHVRLFEKRYPSIRIEMGDMGSQDAAERLIAEETAGRHLTDILSLAVPDLPVILKHNLLARYATPATRLIDKRFQNFLDKENRWMPYYWSEHGISYNTNLFPPDKAPQTWEDLCKPAYKGQVSFDPPETRFMVGLWTLMGEERFRAWLKCMGENQPIIQRGHTQRMTLMLTGDHGVQGDNSLYTGVVEKRKDPKTPFGMALTAPILSFAGAMVINKNAQNPYAAALYTDWTLSEESQKYIAGALRGPLVGKHPYLPDDVKLVTYGYVSDDIVNRLHDYWNQYIGKK